MVDVPRPEDLAVVFEGDKAAIGRGHWRGGSGQGEEGGEKCDSGEEAAHGQLSRCCLWGPVVGGRRV